MKNMLKQLSVIGVALAVSNFALASEGPAGLWKLNTFKVPDGAAATVQMVCFKPDHTWYSSTEPKWNGAWIANGSELHWYGSVALANVGNVATIGMGEMLTATSMTGKYAEWSAPGTAPFAFDRHYTYTFTYQQADCPPPKL